MTDNLPGDRDIVSGDSSIGKAGGEPVVLKIYQTGELTVVGFAGQDVPDEVCLAGYREQMNRLIDDHQVKVMALDLSGVKMIPSGMLGLLVSIRKRVDRVELYNPSDDVREVLRMTNLEKLFDIKSVQF